MLLTILMPLYNEEKTAEQIIESVLNLDLELELIIINNGSTDDTGNIIRQFAERSNVRIIEKKKKRIVKMNREKSPALILAKFRSIIKSKTSYIGSTSHNHL